MTIRKVLVPLDGSDRDRQALNAAFSVAQVFGAHIDAMHVRVQPVDTLPFVGEGMSAALVQELVELSERETAARAAIARKTFEAMRTAANVPLAAAVGAATTPSALWLELEGQEEDAVAAAGRLADLIVLAAPEPSGSIGNPGTFGVALFETGRPVLVAAKRDAPLRFGHIVVAWDASAQAARALAAALPFLARAGKVSIVSAQEPGEGDDLKSVPAYLAWHGIAAESRTIGQHPSVGDALTAAACGADLLVMGGYSHSRLREMILGGVTRHMLGKATLPLLLAH